jgi:histidinol-phosphate aminotransferase
MQPTNRREWLKQSALATLGLGISLRSIGGEDYLSRTFGNGTGLIILGSNENPYGVSPKAKQAIIDMIALTNRYQFNVPALQSFKKELADHYQVTKEQVLVSAGSGEALALFARHFNKGNIVAGTPTFGILPNTAKKLGTGLIEVPLTKEKLHDLPKMLNAINSSTQLVYIVNPANPTGTLLKSSALKNFCIEAGKKAVVLIDEAYIDFVDPPDNESMIGLIEKNPNIVVMRTFSKIHGMAGMRVGFTIGHPSLIRQLEPNYFSSTQFCVSTLAMAAALASLKDEAHQRNCKQKNEEARNYTIKSLQQLKINVIPSYTNFLFMPLGNYQGDFAQDMLNKNILLRSNNYSDGIWARVSIGTMEEMKQFISTLPTILKL